MTPADILGTLTRVGDMAPLVAAAALGLIALAWGATRLILPGLPARRPAKVIGTEGRRKVGLTLKDASMHVHVIGATGSGKSTVLVNLALQDIRARRAVAVVDPVGDISRDILRALPPGSEDRLCLIDATEDWAVGLDVLRGDPELVGEHLDGLFARLFPDSWRSRQSVWLRRAVLTLAGTGATLADVPRLFGDAGFRRQVVRRLDGADHATRRLAEAWREYEALSETARSTQAGPLAGKLDLLILRQPVLHILGQPTDQDPLRLLDEGGIVILRAPQGQIGESAASLLGTAFVALVWDHLRARSSRSRRPPVTLIADECQLAFAPRTLAEMLDLGRKWGLCAVLAHQYLGQLGAGLAKAVAANCRTKVVMQVSDEDAAAFGAPSRAFASLGPSRLGSLPEWRAAVRTKGRPPSVVKTLPPPRGSTQREQAVRAANRTRWGRSRTDIEALLSGHANAPASGVANEVANGGSVGVEYAHANGGIQGVREDSAFVRKLLTDRDMAMLRQIVAEGVVEGPALWHHTGGHSGWAAARLRHLLDLELVVRERAGSAGAASPYAYEATPKGREVAGA